MILTVTLNPCVDHAMFVEQLHPNDSNRVVRVERDAGGKGLNLSRVVAELGGSTVATGFLGGSVSHSIRHDLDSQGVVHRFVPIEGETRVNFSVEDASGLPPTTFNERGPAIQAHELAEFWNLLPELLYAARWLAVGGSLPPGVPASVYADVVAFARSHGVRVMVDGDGEAMRLALEAGPDVVKPNEDEAERLLGVSIASRDDAISAVRQLWSRVQGTGATVRRHALLSRGANGALLACEEGIYEGVPPKVEVKSTIGSGDSLLAGFLFGLENGSSTSEALRLGVACGAATATTSGAEIARRPVIDRLLHDVRVEKIG